MYVSMNNIILGSKPIKDSALSKKIKKKKRHRNKVKNSSFRRKKAKKYPQNQRNNSFKYNYFKFNLGSENIMSNWYWENYKRAMEWQNRHQVAHWKATALALFEENQYLLQIITNLQQGMATGSDIHTESGNRSNLKRNQFEVNPWRSTQKDDDDDDDEEADEFVKEEEEDEEKQPDSEDEDDFEIQMSEEMIHYFEESYKRKHDLEKLKEKELMKSTEQEVEQIKINKMKRTSEMSFLYGEGASMITGMETAVQLSFDKYCDSKSPKYWPNIPFRL